MTEADIALFANVFTACGAAVLIFTVGRFYQLKKDPDMPTVNHTKLDAAVTRLLAENARLKGIADAAPLALADETSAEDALTAKILEVLPPAPAEPVAE